MATQTSQQAIFEALSARYGKRIAQAFLDAINDLRANVDLQRLVKALSDSDLRAAEAALHLDPAALTKLRTAIGDTFEAGGNAAVEGMPTLRDAATGAKFVIRFDPGVPRAEQWVKAESSNLITGIIDGVRDAIRESLRAGLSLGNNPTTTALDIVGRIDRATGKRTGGVIGLSGPQAEYLDSAKAELASTDPALLKNYLARALRDKRYDKAVLRAIETGEAIPAQTQQSALISYSNRMLQLRGQTIARTETLSALHAAQDQAYQQAIDKGAIKANQVRNVWHSAEDSRVRDSHAVLDGQSVGQGQPFTTINGALMRFPGDTSLGAGPEEIINCRCWLQKRIDFLANIT